MLDASAILALYFDEPGADIVRDVVARSFVSSVNYTEVVSVALDRGVSFERLVLSLSAMGFILVPHDLSLARRAGELRLPTKRFGLSTGDRACLALAGREALPALTTDRSWRGLDIGIEVRLIR